MSQKSSNFATVIVLDRHIEILLLSNDCVIVPELGGFMAHHVCARYDEDDGLFLPPLRTLGFNEQLRMNDSLLVQSYIEAYDISYPEALRRIEAEVSELKQTIDNEGSYELNGIGSLSRNSEGSLEFEPCESGILTPALYGLSTFDMPLLESAVQSRKPSHAKPHVHKSESETPRQEKAIVIKMSWVRNAVAIAAAIIAFFLITTPISYSNQPGVAMSSVDLPLIKKEGKQPAIKVETTPAKKLDTMATTAKATEPATESATKPATEPATEPAAKPVTEPAVKPATKPATEPAAKSAVTAPSSAKPQTSYCIVLASQVSQRNAEAFVAKMKKQGLGDTRIYMSNNIRRVVCGSYASEHQAYAALQKVHRLDDCSEAWVYKVKRVKN